MRMILNDVFDPCFPCWYVYSSTKGFTYSDDSTYSCEHRLYI